MAAAPPAAPARLSHTGSLNLTLTLTLTFHLLCERFLNVCKTLYVSSVLHVKSQLKVLGGRIIRAALRAALEKYLNATSPKSWFSPELEPAQVKTTSTLMILGSETLCVLNR